MLFAHRMNEVPNDVEDPVSICIHLLDSGGAHLPDFSPLGIRNPLFASRTLKVASEFTFQTARRCLPTLVYDRPRGNIFHSYGSVRMNTLLLVDQVE